MQRFLLILFLTLVAGCAYANICNYTGTSGAGGAAAVNVFTPSDITGATDVASEIETFMQTHDGTAVLSPGRYLLRDIGFASGEDEFKLLPQVPGTVTLVQDYDTPLMTLDGSADASAEFAITGIQTVTTHGGKPGSSSRCTVTAVTKANPASVTCSSHGFVDGDLAAFTIKTGMTELNDYICTVDQISTSVFTCTNINSTTFTTFVTGQVEAYDDVDNDDNVTELTYTGTLPSWVGQTTYGVVYSENMFLGEDTMSINEITPGATTVIEVMSPFDLSSNTGTAHWPTSSPSATHYAFFDYVTGIPELDNASHNISCHLTAISQANRTFDCDIDTSATTGAFRTVRKKITGITQASPPVVTYSGSDEIYGQTVANGQVLLLEVSGMKQINGACTVANVNTGANTFECSGLDSRAWDTFSAGFIAPLAITDITKANPPVVTTQVAHGLTNGNVINLVVDGMDEMDGSCTVGGATGGADANFTCTGKDSTLYTDFADGYVGDEGYTTINKSFTWMGEPVQVMQVFPGSNKILLYNQLFYDKRMTRSPVIRFINPAKKVTIGDFTIETTNHDDFDWLDPSIGYPPDARASTIIMRAVSSPQIEHLKFNGYWTIGLYRSAVMNAHIGSIEFFGGTNDITPSSISLAYGLREDGPSGFNVTENLWSSAMNRHAYTTGGENGTTATTNTGGEAYALSPWYRRGYNRYNVLEDATCHNTNGQCIDTHEQTVDQRFGHIKIVNSITGPTAYGSGSAGGISNRAVNTGVAVLSCKGGKFCINAQSVEHGVPNTLTIGQVTCSSLPTGKDQDICVRTEAASGLSRPFSYDIGTMVVDNYGKGLQLAEGPQEAHIGHLQTRRIDRAIQLAAGAEAYIGTSLLDYRANERQPSTNTVLLSCDNTDGGAEVYFMTPPSILMGNRATKPNNFIDFAGSTCSNTWYSPGLTVINPYNVTVPAMPNDEAAGAFASTVVQRNDVEYCRDLYVDSTADMATGTAKATLYLPGLKEFTVTGVRAYVNTVATGATLLTVDINEAGTSIISTKLTFDASELSTMTAATPVIISDHTIAAGAKITFDVDAVGNTTAGKGAVACIRGF